MVSPEPRIAQVAVELNVYSTAMGIAKDSLKQDIEFSAWANRLLLEACSVLSDAEQKRNLGMSHRSVLLTLHHIYVSERFWAECLLKNEMPPMNAIGVNNPPPDPRFDEIDQAWPEVWSNLEQWFLPLPEEELGQTLPCQLSADRNFHFTRWQLLRHSVNHSTLHRGQIVSMLRMLGKQPPNLDLMSYLLK